MIKDLTSKVPKSLLYTSCRKKVRYRTEGEVSKARHKCERTRGVKLEYYFCPYCEGFHLTSNISDIDINILNNALKRADKRNETYRKNHPKHKRTKRVKFREEELDA